MRRVPIVPAMSRWDAERWAKKIVGEYRPDLLDRAQPFPVPDFFEMHLYRKYGLKPGPAELPTGIEGLTDQDGNVLLAGSVYEDMMDGDARARFTSVHEGVHGIVHLPTLKRLNCKLVEGGAPTLHRRRDIPAFVDPEWQANRITAGVLMPAKAVRQLLATWNRDPLVISEAFGVSRSAASLRIAELGQMGWL